MTRREPAESTHLEPTQKTVKQLFALSGNLCACPGCNAKLVKSDGSVIAQICHIEAKKKGGERYNPNQTDEERRSFDNLILLCANCHLVTDNVEEYPVEKLKKMKKQHEDKYRDSSACVSEDSEDIVDKILSNYSQRMYSPNLVHTGSGTQINNFGLDYTQARQLFSDLLEQNFPRLQQIAAEEARRRVREFAKKFEYEAENYLDTDDIDGFTDPDLQFVLCKAVEYSARKDSEILRTILSKLLIKRIKNKSENSKNQIYNEAIISAVKLSINQLKIITLCFLVQSQIFNIHVTCFQDLDEYLDKKVEPFLDFSNNYSDFQFIEYCKLCIIGTSYQNNYIHYLLNKNDKFKCLFPNLLYHGLYDEISINETFENTIKLAKDLNILWDVRYISGMNLNIVGVVIAEVFYELYTGEKVD